MTPEIHTLKRTVDLADDEKISLRSKIDELTAQNQELAQAVNARFRGQQDHVDHVSGDEPMEDLKDLSTPEHSPPPSPTKATPRHPALESETLRSSLHHAHRMIQNLKNNIHREKTEKVELKRMLQDARDELEQRRGDPGSGNKRLKIKPENAKKAGRLDMLGGSRRARTDVELEEDGWEDHDGQTPSQPRRLAVPGAFNQSGTTDTSDAYQTSTDVEGAFGTADEKHGTESEDFLTGAESLAGDSTDDLTETEETGTRLRQTGTIRGPKPAALASKKAGDRTSFVSTASTSAGEEDDLQTPVQPLPFKFRVKSGRLSSRQSRQNDGGTPNSLRSPSIAQDSCPATITNDRSPAGAEQSLYAELGDFDETGSDRLGTPGQLSIASARSTPYNAALTPSKRSTSLFKPSPSIVMVDAGVMTEPWQAEPTTATSGLQVPALGGFNVTPYPPSPSDFPLPPSVPVSPVRNADTSTQYTPQRGMQDSPTRNANFITPPKTVWDEAQESENASQGVPTPLSRTRMNHDAYPNMLTQTSTSMSSATNYASHTYSNIQSLESAPIAPRHTTDIPPGQDATKTSDDESRPKTPEKAVADAAGAGLLASAAAALGFNRSKIAQGPVVAEDESSTPAAQLQGSSQGQTPLTEISQNAAPGRTPDKGQKTSHFEGAGPVPTFGSDQGSQTLLTSDQIEKALQPRTGRVVSGSPIVTSLPAAAAGAGSVPQSATATTGPTPETLITSPVKRPASSSSLRSSTAVQKQYPPLPADHMTAIEKAGGRVRSPTREINPSLAGSIMGPPAMPASAMRRPRTPGATSARSPTREGGAQRASQASRHARQATTNPPGLSQVLRLILCIGAG